MRKMLLAGALALAACQSPVKQAPLTVTLQAAQVEAPKVAPPSLPPLDGHPWAEDIIVGGKRVGVVSIPQGAREPRPIMVALHGGGDHEEWSCGEWRGVTSAYPFIVCPHGPGGKNEYYWSSPELTKKEIDQVVEETKARFGVYVKDGPMVLAGFSLGANQAALLGKAMPTAFPRVVIAEGGYDSAPEISYAFAKGGGERALFLCTTVGVCEPSYRRAAALLQKRGIDARVNLAGNIGHGLPEVAIASVRRDWAWMVDGMAGWDTFTPYVEPAPPPGRTIAFAP